MTKEILLGEVIEISTDESNDIYMSMHIRLLTNVKNLNKARFTDAFIQSVVDNQEFYNCMPLVVERKKIESNQYSQMGHAVRKNNTFETDQIGGFHKFYSRMEYVEKYGKEVNCLYGVARVFKRFGKVCESINELYEQGKLFFSVEVSVAEYKVNTEEERVIDAHLENILIGDCIVSFPAEKMSTVEILIAEKKEGEKMADVKTKEVEFFEKTVMCESSELDLGQVRTKVFSKCKEKMGDGLYDYYCSEFGYGYLILEHYQTSDLYKIDYSVNEDNVEISDMYSVKKTYVSISTNSNNEGSSNDKPKDDTVNEVNSKVEDLEKVITDKDKTITELNEKISDKEKEIIGLKQDVNLLSEEVQTQKNEISELNKTKNEFETLQNEIAEQKKEDEQNKLKEKYSKLLSKEVMETDESKKAILELNSNYFKDLVVNNALEGIAENNVETASIIDTIELHGSDVVSKYITRNE